LTLGAFPACQFGGPESDYDYHYNYNGLIVRTARLADLAAFSCKNPIDTMISKSKLSDDQYVRMT